MVTGGNNSVLDGFTVASGNADNGNGGGMFNDSVSLTIANCTFRGNTALNDGGGHGYGGGMYNAYGSSPVVYNCAFIANTAISGGGISNDETCSPKLTNCIFIGNTASSGGGGIYNFGSPTLTNCTFSGNMTTGSGGGIYNFGSPTVTNQWRREHQCRPTICQCRSSRRARWHLADQGRRSGTACECALPQYGHGHRRTTNPFSAVQRIESPIC